MEEAKLQHYRARLLEKRGDLEAQLSMIKAGGLDESMNDSTQELSLYDNHPADVGTELFERSKSLALRDNAVIQLNNIDSALARMREGFYGLCVDCREPIGEARLEALPETIQCLRCRVAAEGQGNMNPRPVEEDVVHPPFNLPPTDDYAHFDGEDAWQAVARYGTSETPSDIGEEHSQYPNVYEDWDEDRGAVEDVDSMPYTLEEDSQIMKDYTP